MPEPEGLPVVLGEPEADTVLAVPVAEGDSDPLAVGDTVPDPDAVNDTLAVAEGDALVLPE